MDVSDKRTETLLKELAAAVAELRELIANRPRLHRKDVMRRYGFSESTLHRRLRKCWFPAPRRFGGPLWRLADLEAAERSGTLPRPVPT